MIRVFIADDHEIVRQGLIQVVSNSGDITVVGEASSGRETIQELQNNYYDVILLDIHLPDMSGLEVLKEIIRQRPELCVLVLSMHPEEQYAVRVLKAGASGYITKGAKHTELVAAIRRVASGGKYISPSLAEKLASRLKLNNQEPLHQSLSDREYEVMLMIASGKKTREIAEELFLDDSTIHTYRARILRKMRVKSNAELTRYSIENGLIA
ncbi:response regulator [Chloroflexota bacterium]